VFLIDSIEMQERDRFQDVEHNVLPKKLHPGLIRAWFHPRIKSDDTLFAIMLDAARKGEP
jgi:hypothetical protein